MNDGIMESLIEQNPDAIIFADLKGTIRVWNVTAERIFGFTKEQAIGSKLDIIVPQKLREAHWRGYQQAMEKGETKYIGKSLPTKSLHADGSVIYVELSFSIILDASKSVIGALSTARDITAKYKKERGNQKSSSNIPS